MTTQLTELLQQAMEQHTKVYSKFEPDHEGRPMYFLYKGVEQCTVIMIDTIPENSLDKMLLVQQIRSIADKEQCDAFVNSSEAWTIPQNTVALSLPGERFAQRPDRIEVLSLSAGTRSGAKAMVHAYIIRSADQPPKLDWQPIIVDGVDGCQVQSRLDIFNMQTPVRPPSNFHPTAQ